MLPSAHRRYGLLSSESEMLGDAQVAPGHPASLGMTPLSPICTPLSLGIAAFSRILASEAMVVLFGNSSPGRSGLPVAVPSRPLLPLCR